MRRVVALVPEFESNVTLQLPLQDEIPFMHQRIVEILLHAAHRNAGVQRERTKWISAREAARHEIAVETLRLVDTYESAVALVARKVYGFIKGHAFPTVGAAALVLLTTVEDPISDAKHRLLHNLVSDADTRSKVSLIPRNQIIGYLPARYGDIREQCAEVRRQRSV